MITKSHISRRFYQINKIFVFVGVLLLTTSCDLFFQKELKQDVRLSYYRHRTAVVNDSIESNLDRIQAYKFLITEAGQDERLITPRKKNLLLSNIYTTLSREYFDLYRIDESIESNTIAIALNISNEHAYFNRGCLYQLLGKDSLAIDDYTRALLYNENYADAYYNRGIIYEEQTDFQLAIEDYSHAIKLEPSYLVDVYNNRGNTYLEMDFYEKAINDYNMALRIDSTKAITYCNRADAYLKIGNVEKAFADCSIAMKMDSTNVSIIDKVKVIRSALELD